MNDWLARASAMHPEREAVNGLSYAELLSAARTRADALEVGERVAIMASADEDFAIALHGCFLAGAAAVPIDPRLSVAERAARSVGGRTATPDIATLMYTSGTTAEPRPVELTYRNWLANARGSAVALGLDRDERWLCALPLAHVGGLSILIRSAIYGTSVLLHEGFEVERVLEALRDESLAVTLVSLVPTMLQRLLDAGLREPPTLRWVLLGGAPIPAALLERARRAGVPVATTYGMTEACSQIATHGWPLPGVEVSIAADGEVLVRGDVVAPGAVAGDGWLHTGDLGSLGDDGRLTIIGRRADTIITGGENVVPGEVEAVLLEHPAVADAGVFGRLDPEWGESVVARVVLRASVSDDELLAFCRERLAAFKIPKRIEFARVIPRTPSGKLLRRKLG